MNTILRVDLQGLFPIFIFDKFVDICWTESCLQPSILFQTSLINFFFTSFNFQMRWLIMIMERPTPL
jgi:hypothetical protein